MERERKVFRSRISVLLLGFFLTMLVLSLLSCTFIVVLTAGGGSLFAVLVFGGMRYVIAGRKLYLKIMFVVPYGYMNIANIVSVKRTYNPLSSPAASLKRLKISDKTGWAGWLISPVREKEFVEALKAINPNIRVNIPERKGVWRIWDWDI